MTRVTSIERTNKFKESPFKQAARIAKKKKLRKEKREERENREDKDN